MSDLKPCPHCGKTETLEFATRREEEDCPRFEDCEAKECKRGACDYFDTWDSVVCSVSSGGCGASGGYASCPAKAAEKWNRRAERTCKRVLFEPTGVLVCSECGAGMPKQLDKYCYLHYCPNCGARVERREQ